MRPPKLLICLIALFARANSLCAQHVPGSVLDRAPGSGLYEVYLKPDRTIARVVVLQSCGSRRLDEEAIVELKTWRFNKTPTSIQRIKVPITFKLR